MSRIPFDDIERLTRILEAELEGRAVDHDEARRLAGRLAEECPGIASTMSRIATRMGPARLRYEAGRSCER
jgi:hypothetical protein